MLLLLLSMLANNETGRGERLNAAAAFCAVIYDEKRSIMFMCLRLLLVLNVGREAVFSRDDPCVSIRILRTGL
jgi:hypothetical protein